MTIHDPDLLDAIERLGTEALNEVTVWRHMFNDNPPELSNTRGARWNPAGVAAIYTSEDRATAVAEGQHAIDVQPLRPKARRFVYELRVSARNVLRIRLSDFPALGLAPPTSIRMASCSCADMDKPPLDECLAGAARSAWLCAHVDVNRASLCRRALSGAGRCSLGPIG